MSDRKRIHRVYVRLSDEEYQVFMEKYHKSACSSLNAFFLDALLNAKITSAEEIIELKQIDEHISEIVKQIKGACNNINQIAHVANRTGLINSEEIKRILHQINDERKEVEELWRLTRYARAMLEHRGP